MSGMASESAFENPAPRMKTRWSSDIQSAPYPLGAATVSDVPVDLVGLCTRFPHARLPSFLSGLLQESLTGLGPAPTDASIETQAWGSARSSKQWATAIRGRPT